MTFSFVIIGRNESECASALGALAMLSGEKFETLLSLGENPSQQRNEAAKEASGDYIIFLDNDSRVHPRLLQYYRDALSYEHAIKVVGGPSIYSGGDSHIGQSFQAVFASVFGLGPFRARYSSIGVVRPSDENELILCNLLIDRQFFLDEGGFNQHLYPNEENEFLDRVRSRAKVYYHPLALCYRDPPESVLQFAKKMYRYGKGRAKHFVLFQTLWNQIFLVPAAFTLYSIGVASAFPFSLPSPVMLALLTPMTIYAIFNFSASMFAALGNRRLTMLIIMPWLFFACHFLYGFGFIAGLLVYPVLKRNRRSSQIQVVRVSGDAVENSA